MSVDTSRANKGVGDQVSCYHLHSAQHPQPRHADITELPQLEGQGLGVRWRLWASQTTPTGHTASRSHGRLKVYSACFQNAVGKSVGLGLCPNKEQTNDLHRDREGCPGSPALSHLHSCVLGPLPAQLPADFLLLSPEPHTLSWDFHNGPGAS